MLPELCDPVFNASKGLQPYAEAALPRTENQATVAEQVCVWGQQHNKNNPATGTELMATAQF